MTLEKEEPKGIAVRLLEPQKGYTRGELTGSYGDHQHEVELPNGALVYLYESEFEQE